MGFDKNLDAVYMLVMSNYLRIKLYRLYNYLQISKYFSIFLCYIQLYTLLKNFNFWFPDFFIVGN